jgi:hypothetical protein
MPAAGRLYPYVGPAELREPGREPSGIAITSQAMLAAWLDGRGRDELAEPFTFTVSANGDLLLAPRRSEHVHCAGGREVLAVGEITFSHGGQAWSAVAVTIAIITMIRPGDNAKAAYPLLPTMKDGRVSTCSCVAEPGARFPGQFLLFQLTDPHWEPMPLGSVLRQWPRGGRR